MLQVRNHGSTWHEVSKLFNMKVLPTITTWHLMNMKLFANHASLICVIHRTEKHLDLNIFHLQSIGNWSGSVLVVLKVDDTSTFDGVLKYSMEHFYNFMKTKIFLSGHSWIQTSYTSGIVVVQICITCMSWVIHAPELSYSLQRYLLR